MLKFLRLIFINLLVSINLLFFSNYANSQLADSFNHTPNEVLENCFYLDCKKIYSQEKLQSAAQSYFLWALEPRYYQRPTDSKMYLKAASLLLKEITPCDVDKCSESLINWSKESLLESQAYLSCIHSINTSQYDKIIRNLSVYYSAGNDGASEWPYEFTMAGPHGAFAFINKNDFPPCSNLKVSEETLFNLRLMQPQLGNGIF